jgi:hypothetical protein
MLQAGYTPPPATAEFSLLHTAIPVITNALGFLLMVVN